ncbi:MAG: ATP-binding protein [Aquincola tertiaricarbonis]|uniref:GAF domain-containing sensor histidine kinase n=1 Tax=Aquincola sp. J276 TaxID=2898432 RepID=UPI0021518AA1|nr:GAF domain-containing sensor histidine kinase [Aquincola sp. J276]MCR5867744.1 GAF domain-containing sensor histidine kinase [Aquincola sp. J276]
MTGLPDSETVAIARDLEAVRRVSAVPTILRILCDTTGMGFAAVARVSDQTWTACAVEDHIGFGLQAGAQLELATTLCVESRAARAPIVIENVAESDLYRDHHTPRIYGLQSYVSVPIVLGNGDYFGNLCCIDPRPAQLDRPGLLATFTAYADLIGRQLDLEGERLRADQALVHERSQSALLEQYVAVLGHDLRNPLGAIMACAELLARRKPGIDPSDLVRRILASGERMGKLIGDVLDFTRIRFGGGLPVQPRFEHDLGAALHNVIAEMAVQHPERTVDEALQIRGIVWCDTARLQQLLSNLLGNALVHGAADQPVRVEARLTGGELVLRVANGGDPIPPDQLVQIFEPYYRPPSSRQGGGLGLGLHICAQIAAAHGGRLEAASDAVQGTVFTARLPVTQPLVPPAVG